MERMRVGKKGRTVGIPRYCDRHCRGGSYSAVRVSEHVGMENLTRIRLQASGMLLFKAGFDSIFIKKRLKGAE